MKGFAFMKGSLDISFSSVILTYIYRVTEGDDAMFTRAHENATPILTQYMYSNHGPDDYDEMSIPDETPYSFSH